MADEPTTGTTKPGDVVTLDHDFLKPIDEDGDGRADKRYIADIDHDGKDEVLEVCKEVEKEDGSVREYLVREKKPPRPVERPPLVEDAIADLLAGQARASQERLSWWLRFRKTLPLNVVFLAVGTVLGMFATGFWRGSGDPPVIAPPPASTTDPLARVAKDLLETPSTRARLREEERERIRRAWESHTGTNWEDRP